MAVSLLEHTALTATFRAGTTPLGHHWELLDPEENVVGTTEREYSGGRIGRALWKSVTVTGMDGANDIRAKVMDAGGTEIVGLFSRNDQKDLRVEITRPDESPLAVVHRVPGEGFTYKDAGGTVLATIPIAKDQSDPWELLDASGGRIGVVTREKAKLAEGATLLDYAFGMNTITDNQRDRQNTMHFGFAFSKTYSVTLAELPGSEPLRTLAVLTPVIAGYAY